MAVTPQELEAMKVAQTVDLKKALGSSVQRLESDSKVTWKVAKHDFVTAMYSFGGTL